MSITLVSMGERSEVLMRIIVAIVTGIILHFWKLFILVLTVVNALWTLIAGKRIKDLSELSEIWNTQEYMFTRYMVFQSNKRPFPFTPIAKNISKYE